MVSFGGHMEDPGHDVWLYKYTSEKAVSKIG